MVQAGAFAEFRAARAVIISRLVKKAVQLWSASPSLANRAGGEVGFDDGVSPDLSRRPFKVGQSVGGGCLSAHQSRVQSQAAPRDKWPDQSDRMPAGLVSPSHRARMTRTEPFPGSCEELET